MPIFDKMSSNQFTPAKGHIYRLTLALLMFLSIFSVSAPIGLSTFQPEKSSTELALSTRQQTVSHSAQYYSLNLNRHLAPPYVCQLKKQHKYAVLRFNELHIIRFEHQSLKFLGIKPIVQQLHSLTKVLKPWYELFSA